MLAPEPGSVFRLLSRPPVWLHPEDVQQLRESTEEFSVVLRDMSGLIERIKLLQEEVIARLDEQNNRVGGVPLAENHHGFWMMVGLVAGFTALIAWWVVRRRNNQ